MSAPKPNRLCTLWGKTFDLGDFHGVFDDITDVAVSVRGWEVPAYPSKACRTRAHIPHAFYEAMCAITMARNPPLDMAHASEIGYKFKAGQLYKTNAGLHMFVTEDGNVVHHYGSTLLTWFYPCDNYGRPTIQGEEEALVRVYEPEHRTRVIIY